MPTQIPRDAVPGRRGCCGRGTSPQMRRVELRQQARQHARVVKAQPQPLAAVSPGLQKPLEMALERRGRQPADQENAPVRLPAFMRPALEQRTACMHPHEIGRVARIAGGGHAVIQAGDAGLRRLGQDGVMQVLIRRRVHDGVEQAVIGRRHLFEHGLACHLEFVRRAGAWGSRWTWRFSPPWPTRRRPPIARLRPGTGPHSHRSRRWCSPRRPRRRARSCPHAGCGPAADQYRGFAFGNGVGRRTGHSAWSVTLAAGMPPMSTSAWPENGAAPWAGRHACRPLLLQVVPCECPGFSS